MDFQPQGDPVLNAFGALLGSYFSTTPRVILADISQCSLVPGLFFFWLVSGYGSAYAYLFPYHHSAYSIYAEPNAP